ncbi:hypothetical protein [Siminovitchia fordii]|uniref:Uncharacterized protein n=1 Tax=Siminovitchia fordii TaxID=254759 RepID=A0ABQ4KBR1_9BACI|nr:hypothetical protein [Siminovitchia fordii]GIN22520.1 hypothetical protein J1TS3_36540 [Siminovitchia fordii]
MNLEKALQSVREIYVNTPKQYELANNELKKINDEIQDILHIFELGKVDAIAITKLGKDLKKLRKQRRKLKEEIEVLEKVKRFISHQKPTEKIINNSIGEVRSTIEKQKKRSYKLRVRKDLQHLLNH